MHDGNPAFAGNHWYALIYDFAQEKWRKYNDHTVTEIDEDQVMKESFGQDAEGWKTAYWLVYIKKSMIDA